MTLLKNVQQQEVSEQVRLPVDNVGTDAKVSITGETVQLEYWNAGTLTVDAGQAAGVAAQGSLAYRNIKNAAGDMTGTSLDSSLSFTSTAFTSEVAFPYGKKEQFSALAGDDRLDAITAGFAEGEYCVDYRTGVIYGVKADNSLTLTATAYKVETNTSGGGSGGIASDVNVAKVGGTAITLGQKAMASSIPVVLPSDQTIGGADVDDSAFAVGTDQGQVVMGFYSAAGDNVNDGDKGAIAMTQARHAMVRDDAYDSLTQANKSAEVNPLSSQYVPSVPLNATVVTGTTAYVYIDMNGYRNVGIQTIKGGGGTATFTYEATCQDDGTAAASCTYNDVTNALIGAATFTASALHLVDTMLPVKWLRLKYVTAGGVDSTIRVNTKKLY